MLTSIFSRYLVLYAGSRNVYFVVFIIICRLNRLILIYYKDISENASSIFEDYLRLL